MLISLESPRKEESRAECSVSTMSAEVHVCFDVGDCREINVTKRLPLKDGHHPALNGYTLEPYISLQSPNAQM